MDLYFKLKFLHLILTVYQDEKLAKNAIKTYDKLYIYYTRVNREY